LDYPSLSFLIESSSVQLLCLSTVSALMSSLIVIVFVLVDDFQSNHLSVTSDLSNWP
jgi:hypothetical protein